MSPSSLSPRLALALIVLATACSSPGPPSHLTRLWKERPGVRASGEPVLGLSTEDGVLVLAAPGYAPEDRFDIQFPVGNSIVRDWGVLNRLNDNLAVVYPITARLLEGRFAASLPEAHETLYLAVRGEQDAPVMQATTLWHDGQFGDWLSVPSFEADSMARKNAGAGIYLHRNDRWEICGMASGLVARLEGDAGTDSGLGFLGLAELARILPDQLPYYLHMDRPLRPDFEFGAPLQPGDLQIYRSEDNAVPVDRHDLPAADEDEDDEVVVEEVEVVEEPETDDGADEPDDEPEPSDDGR